MEAELSVPPSEHLGHRHRGPRGGAATRLPVSLSFPTPPRPHLGVDINEYSQRHTQGTYHLLSPFHVLGIKHHTFHVLCCLSVTVTL